MTDLNVSLDDKLVASASCDMTIRVWNMGAEPIAVLHGHTSDVMRVLMCKASGVYPNSIMSFSLDGTFGMWDISASRNPPEILCAGKPSNDSLQPEVSVVAVKADASEIICGCNDGVVRVFRMNERRHQRYQELKTHQRRASHRV